MVNHLTPILLSESAVTNSFFSSSKYIATTTGRISINSAIGLRLKQNIEIMLTLCIKKN